MLEKNKREIWNLHKHSAFFVLEEHILWILWKNLSIVGVIILIILLNVTPLPPPTPPPPPIYTTAG